MRKEDIEIFLNKRVKLTCVVESGLTNDKVTLTYTGKVIGVSDSTLTIHDKFDKIVAISLDSLKQIGEFVE